MIRQSVLNTVVWGILAMLTSLPVATAQEPPEPTEPAEAATTEAAPASVETEPQPSAATIPAGTPPEPVEEAGTSKENPAEAKPIPEKPAEEKPVAQEPVAQQPPSEHPVQEKIAPEQTTTAKATPEAAPAANDPAMAELRRTGPRKLFELAGMDDSHFRPIRETDGWPLGDDELEILLKLIYRVQRFGPLETSLWTSPQAPLAEMSARPDEYRWQMFYLRGRVLQVMEEKPPAEVMQRYDMDKYYACQLELDGSKQPVLVITPRIPAGWNISGPLNEPVSVQGLFIKRGEQRGEKSQLIFVAARVAWHPDQVREDGTPHAVTFGMTELGRLGMDVSLLEDVQNKERIGERDREAFYQMLAAVERAPQNQLVRFATSNLESMRQIWQQEIPATHAAAEKLRAELKGFTGTEEEAKKLKTAAEKMQRKLAVLQRAEQDAGEGRYSVYPLFNLAEEQHGRLVLLEGVAKQAIKVEVVNPVDPQSNQDIAQRFGINHYYEIAIFTKDSADNPLIVCARELPPGFPTGSSINESVQIAGFFFKTWAFYTTQGVDAQGQLPPTPRQQLAPLLIARSPIWIPREPVVQNPRIAIILALTFVSLLAVAWLSVWRFNRKDEKFRKEVLVRKYALDTGVSLNDAGLETTDGPDFSHLSQPQTEEQEAKANQAAQEEENKK